MDTSYDIASFNYINDKYKGTTIEYIQERKYLIRKEHEYFSVL